MLITCSKFNITRRIKYNNFFKLLKQCVKFINHFRYNRLFDLFILNMITNIVYNVSKFFFVAKIEFYNNIRFDFNL